MKNLIVLFFSLASALSSIAMENDKKRILDNKNECDEVVEKKHKIDFEEAYKELNALEKQESDQSAQAKLKSLSWKYFKAADVAESYWADDFLLFALIAEHPEAFLLQIKKENNNSYTLVHIANAQDHAWVKREEYEIKYKSKCKPLNTENWVKEYRKKLAIELGLSE